MLIQCQYITYGLFYTNLFYLQFLLFYIISILLYLIIYILLLNFSEYNSLFL